MSSYASLPTSTMTIMAYSNALFSFPELFSGVVVSEFPRRGDVVSLRYGSMARGRREGRKKRFKCSFCRLGENRREVEEVPAPLDGGVIEIRFVCRDCGRSSEPQAAAPFPHQMTFVVSLGKRNVNVMLFKDNLKMAGNRSLEDAVAATRALWRNVEGIEGGWKADGDVKFLFEVVMKNVKMCLPYQVDKERLHDLARDYGAPISSSMFSCTSDDRVNIKMETRKPKGMRWAVLSFPGGALSWSNERFLPATGASKKAKKGKFTTFLVYTSSATISGRFDEDMEKGHDFLVDLLANNRAEVEERVVSPTEALGTWMERNFPSRPREEVDEAVPGRP